MSLPAVFGKVIEPISIGGTVKLAFKRVKGPLSYTTGGDLLEARDLGSTWFLAANGGVISTDGTRIAYFFSSPTLADLCKTVKMLILDVATGVQVANATDQTTKEFVVPVFYIG